VDEEEFLESIIRNENYEWWHKHNKGNKMTLFADVYVPAWKAEVLYVSNRWKDFKSRLKDRIHVDAHRWISLKAFNRLPNAPARADSDEVGSEEEDSVDDNGSIAEQETAPLARRERSSINFGDVFLAVDEASTSSGTTISSSSSVSTSATLIAQPGPSNLQDNGPMTATVLGTNEITAPSSTGTANFVMLEAVSLKGETTGDPTSSSVGMTAAGESTSASASSGDDPSTASVANSASEEVHDKLRIQGNGSQGRKRKLDESDEEEVCPICLAGFSRMVKVVKRLPCDHEFHKDCLFTWVRQGDGNGDCPLCRQCIQCEGRRCQVILTFFDDEPQGNDYFYMPLYHL